MHLESAKRTIQTEIEGLQYVLNNLDEQFNLAIEAFASIKGKLIVCGMGKSGHIGKKIAATLASTGTSAFFVHPAEAFHGDLGMIGKEDAFLSISNSGETDELLQVIPRIQAMGIPHITMVGNINSTLGQHADITLSIAVPKEACVLQLAPTSSTTATLALGDAIAVALMEQKNFQAADFAQFHPGGSLGRKLLTKVKDLMETQIPFCSLETTGRELIHIMTAGKLGLAVIQSENEFGIVTDGDLRRAMDQYEETFFTTPVSEFYTKQPKTILETDSASHAEELMLQHNISSVIVLNKNSEISGILQIYAVQ